MGEVPRIYDDSHDRTDHENAEYAAAKDGEGVPYVMSADDNGAADRAAPCPPETNDAIKEQATGEGQ